MAKKQSKHTIKINFANGHLQTLRERLLSDLTKESFAILLAKRSEVEPSVFCVYSIRFPLEGDIVSRSIGHVSPSKEFIYSIIAELIERYDVDTIIDVHTHPFSKNDVAFSSIDDSDEKRFFTFLHERLPNINYGSVVFSQSSYQARFWAIENKKIIQSHAHITDFSLEEPNHAINDMSESLHAMQITSRTRLAVGIDTIRQIATNQKIAIIGVGGIGSIVAENLIQMGFSHITLIDDDIVEFSNLGRIVGASYDDAKNKKLKVEVSKKHLLSINPSAKIIPAPYKVQDERVKSLVADCTWMIVCTDNHSSRYEAQRLSHSLFIPLISAGVNISVNDGQIEDMSGEVINCKIGSGFCLICTGRINHMKIAVESLPERTESQSLVSKGYVSGENTPEPAVKTLNSIIAALTVDTLLNEFTHRQKSVPILVYESNLSPCIYEDTITFAKYEPGCGACMLADSLE